MTTTNDYNDLQAWVDNVSDPINAPYFNHLHDQDFERPVRFRIRGETSDTMLPTFDIQIALENRHGFKETESLEIASSVEESRTEFSFDAALADPTAVLTDVQTLLENYNEPPEDLPDDKISEWTSTEIADVTAESTDE